MLMLLRHAKSSWEDPEPDVARPLNPRGRRDAPVMARALAGLGFAPSRVLSSPARRTRETLALMAPEWALPDPVFLGALYEADASTLGDILDAEGADGTLLVGHAPGLHDLAQAACDTALPGGPSIAVLDRLPTCAFAAIDLKERRLLAYLTPKGLARSEPA